MPKLTGLLLKDSACINHEGNLTYKMGDPSKCGGSGDPGPPQILTRCETRTSYDGSTTKILHIA